MLDAQFHLRRLRDRRVALLICGNLMDAVVIKRQLEGKRYWWVTRARKDTAPNGYNERVASDGLKVDFVNRTTFWELINKDKYDAEVAGETIPDDPPRTAKSRRELEKEYRLQKLTRLPSLNGAEDPSVQEWSELSDIDVTEEDLLGRAAKPQTSQYSVLDDVIEPKLTQLADIAHQRKAKPQTTQDFSDLEDFTEEELISLATTY